MKLSTLLLSSAALVVAGSAYAADLPAKKGAPAKAATGCPAFGAGFFQIPGGDTCIKFGGHVRYKASYTSDSTDEVTAAYGQAYRFRLEVDARSNSEFGALRGYARLNSTPAATVDRALVSVAGLTVGRMGSLADIAGTNADTYGSNLGGGTGIGARYDVGMGSSTVSFAVENAANNNGDDGTDDYVSDRPDLLAGFKTSAGPANITLVAVTHEAKQDAGSDAGVQGYAFLGKVGMSSGAFGASIFGGTAVAAADYVTDTTTTALTDYDGSDKSTATNFGGEVTFNAGSGTFALAADQSSQTLGSDTVKITNYGLSYAFNAAKGLAIEPEFISSTTDDNGTKSTSNTVYLRIQRDF